MKSKIKQSKVRRKRWHKWMTRGCKGSTINEKRSEKLPPHALAPGRKKSRCDAMRGERRESESPGGEKSDGSNRGLVVSEIPPPKFRTFSGPSNWPYCYCTIKRLISPVSPLMPFFFHIDRTFFSIRFLTVFIAMWTGALMMKWESWEKNWKFWWGIFGY